MMDSLKKLSALMLSNEDPYHNSELKRRFCRTGKKAMRELASVLELKEFDVRFNHAGPACSGDLTLMGMWSEGNGIYITMNKDQFHSNPQYNILYRTITNMKDYTGGCNRYTQFQILTDNDKMLRTFLSLNQNIQIGE
jgi:hypothetical protein